MAVGSSSWLSFELQDMVANLVQVDWRSYTASAFSLTNGQTGGNPDKIGIPRVSHYHVGPTFMLNSSVQRQSMVQSRVHSPAFVVSH